MLLVFFFLIKARHFSSQALFDSLFILVELVSARCWNISGKSTRVVPTASAPVVAGDARVVALCRGSGFRDDQENTNYVSQTVVTQLNHAKSKRRQTSQVGGRVEFPEAFGLPKLSWSCGIESSTQRSHPAELSWSCYIKETAWVRYTQRTKSFTFKGLLCQFYFCI